MSETENENQDEGESAAVQRNGYGSGDAEGLYVDSQDLTRVRIALDVLRGLTRHTETTRRVMKLLSSEEAYLSASVELRVEGY